MSGAGRDPDRIEFRNRLKGYTVAGIVLLALGSFFLAAVFFHTVFEGLSARYWLLAAIPALGAGLLTWRWGAVIDRRAGIVTKWWGFLVPLFKRAHAIYEFEAATVTHEQRSVPDSQGGLDTYVVKLVKRNGATVAIAECPYLYELARRQAEKLGQFLDLPVRNEAGGAP